MTHELEFTAAGRPLPLKRHRSTRTGRMYDPSADDKRAWLALVRGHVPDVPFAGPLVVNAVFRMPRPRTHFRTGRFAHERKPTAPTFHTSTPDVDNLAKFVLDAMNGHFFVDDSQIVELRCHKVYADGHDGSTAIRIRSVIQGAVETASTPQPPVVPLLCEPPCVQLFL